MTDPSLEALFWEEVDGPPSAARRERIEALAGERLESRRELDALEELAAALDRVEEVAPPAELRAEVRRQVAARAAHSRRAAGAGWLQALAAAGWRPRLALAASLVLIVVVGWELITSGRSPVSEAERSRLSGALNVGGGSAPHELPLAGSAGVIRFSRDGAALVVGLTPARGTTLELALDGEGRGLELLRLDGGGWERQAAGAAPPGSVRLVGDGPLSLAVRVAGDEPRGVRVRVFTAAGESLLDERLEPSWSSGGESRSPTSDPVSGIQQ